MIKQAWSLQKTGSRVAQLRNKLRNIRRKAPDWNRTVFGRVESEIKGGLPNYKKYKIP